MKRFFLIVPIMLFAAFSACKKAKGPADGKSVQPNNNLDSLVSMSASINGHPWQTDSVFGSYVQQSANDSGVVNLLIYATLKKNDSVSTIKFTITNFVGPNIYTINPPVNTATYYFGNTRYYATSGQIVVTSDTAYSIIGTFNFIADSVTVAGGAFNVAMP